MKSILIAISLLLSLSITAQEIKVGVSNTNIGPIQKKDVLNIVKCTAKIRDKTLKIVDIPTLRGRSLVKEKRIDAFYPSHTYEEEKNFVLFPIYIDEVILIVKNKNDLDNKNLKVGTIRGDHERILKEYPLLKASYIVGSVESLLNGVKNGRVNALVAYRSQLKDRSLDKFHYKTLFYEDIGVKITSNFVKKVNISQKELQQNFLKCILSYDYKLSKIRKSAILRSMKKDFLRIQNELAFSKVTIENIQEKDAQWKSGSTILEQEVYNNKQTKKLKNLLKKFGFINEAFIFNHKGGLLSSIKNTSDFDQSDEKKFEISKNKLISIKNISNIYFDSSSSTFQVGITIRLSDQSGNYTGGLFLGADINKLLLYYQLI